MTCGADKCWVVASVAEVGKGAGVGETYALILHSNITGKQCYNITYGLSDRKREDEIEHTVPKHYNKYCNMGTVHEYGGIAVALDLDRSFRIQQLRSTNVIILFTVTFQRCHRVLGVETTIIGVHMGVGHFLREYNI